jgi:hypothetical protein
LAKAAPSRLGDGTAVEVEVAMVLRYPRVWGVSGAKEYALNEAPKQGKLRVSD